MSFIPGQRVKITVGIHKGKMAEVTQVIDDDQVLPIGLEVDPIGTLWYEEDELEEIDGE